MNRQELIELVTEIINATGTEEYQDSLLDKFEASVPHPKASDLIYYSDYETAEEIVSAALAYKSIQL